MPAPLPVVFRKVWSFLSLSHIHPQNNWACFSPQPDNSKQQDKATSSRNNTTRSPTLHGRKNHLSDVQIATCRTLWRCCIKEQQPCSRRILWCRVMLTHTTCTKYRPRLVLLSCPCALSMNTSENRDLLLVQEIKNNLLFFSGSDPRRTNYQLLRNSCCWWWSSLLHHNTILRIPPITSPPFGRGRDRRRERGLDSEGACGANGRLSLWMGSTERHQAFFDQWQTKPGVEAEWKDLGADSTPKEKPITPFRS